MPLAATRRRPLALAAGLVLAVVVATCSNDLNDSVLLRQPRTVPLAYTDAGLGFDPALLPTAPLGEFAFAGASLPRSGGAGDLLLGFVAFTTAAPGDDADGNGTALDRSTPPPPDGNQTSDVFLAAVVNTERLVNGRATPTAFVQGLAPILRDPRCVRCHSFHYPDGWRVAGHVGSLPAGSNANCAECHVPADILVPGTAPTSVQWFAPDAEQTASPTMDMRGKTDRQLFDQLMAVPEPASHLATDERILWAIGHGRVPFRGQSVGGRVPMDPQQWQDLIQAWDLAGRPFSTDAAVRDIVLVSQRDDGTAAGDGASDAPSITFEPNPAFVPTTPGAAPAGWVHVAFASAATDLLVGSPPATRRHVYRATVEVWLDGGGDVDLRVDAAALARLSERSGGGEPDGDSGAPSIAADGDLVAFTSTATDLVPGFVDNNGAASDVFVRGVTAATTWLASGSSSTAGGNGASSQPAIAADGSAVAFASRAGDLVAGDTNGVQDVFVCSDVTTTPVVRRVSVPSGGAEGSGGDSGAPSIFVDTTAGETFVAFESQKNDLFGLGGATPAVFVHALTAATTTRLVPRTATATSPWLSPDGSRVVFVSAAELDPLRTDANGRDDVFAFDLAAFRATGTATLARLSLAATGADATAAAAMPRLTGFRNLSGALQSDLLLGLQTTATNVGRSPNSDLVLQFLVDRLNPRTAAEFNAAPLAGTAPLLVSFNDLSSNAVSWAWDFGDGQQSTLQNPMHTYASVGTYDVELTVTGPGGTSTARKNAYVEVTLAAKPWTQIFAENALATSCGTAGCHGPPGATAPFPITSAAGSYAALINVPAVGGCAPTPRVTPGNPAQSVLLDRVSIGGSCGGRMGTLGPQAIQDISDWIQAGAPN